MDLESYRKKLPIDIEALHICCAEHSVFYEEVAREAAEAKGEAEQAKALLELAEAQLDSAIRARPEDYGLAKITESAIKSAIVASGQYQTANTAYLEARSRSGELDVLATAFDHRRSMINNEVNLFAANYWGQTSIAEGQKAKNDIAERIARKRSQRGS